MRPAQDDAGGRDHGGAAAMWSTGTGSEIMQRIAVPMIGGMISSTVLTLIVIPAIFGLVKGIGLPDDDQRLGERQTANRKAAGLPIEGPLPVQNGRAQDKVS